MLPSTSLKKALFACLPSPSWKLPSITMESALSFPCSDSDLPSLSLSLSLAKVRLLLTLNLSSLTIWNLGQTALFLLYLAKAAPVPLSTALSVALKPLFLFQQAQYAQVFPLKPAPFCKLFAGLGSTITSAIFLLLLSDSRSDLVTLPSPPSFLLY